MSDDLRVVVGTYLDGLPATIRSGLINSIAVFYSGRQPLSVTQAETVVADALKSEDMVTAPRAVLFLCASIDHVLTRASTHAEVSSQILKRAAEDTGSKGLATEVLAEPLKEKHFQQAREDWNRLRENQLSAQKIVDYEYILLKRLLSSLR
jgi:hypothetical protein